jgi:hypothetical protein
MSKETRMRAAAWIGMLMLTYITFRLVAPGGGRVESVALAQDPQPPAVAAEADYVGMTKCAACHYAQFRDWRETPHGKAHEILPTKYRQDESCLECHSTGFGHPASPEAAAANLKGVSCEACHGPGGKHARYALTFVGEGRELTDDALTVLRSQIQRLSMAQCIRCHVSMAHKPHPEFDREPAPARGVRPGPRDAAATNFFRIHN